MLYYSGVNLLAYSMLRWQYITLQKFLPSIPGGLFGKEIENKLLNVLKTKEPAKKKKIIKK